MRILCVGSGGVGESIAAIFKRRDPRGELIQTMVMADYDLAKAQACAARLGDARRFPAAQVDAADVAAVVALPKSTTPMSCCSLLPVKYNLFTLDAALKAGIHHLDASTSLSEPHPTDPFNKCGARKLGEEEFALTPEFEPHRQAGARRLGRRAGHGRLALPLRRRPPLRRDRRDRHPRRRQPRDPRARQASASASPSG